MNKLWDVLATLFFALMAVFLIYTAYDSYTFDKACTSTAGTLNGKYTKRCHGFYCKYDVSYTFSYQGKIYEGFGTMGDEPLVKEAQIYFLPDNPSKNHPERESAIQSLLAAGFFLFLAVRSIRKLAKKAPLD